MATKQFSESRLLWLFCGLAAGIAISQFWPHEQAMAVTNDRSAKFGLATVEVSALGTSEGVFVLDYLTGQLRGAVINSRTGKFTHFYARNIAADFNVNPMAEPHYAMVTGKGNLPSTRGVTPATGVVYIGELSSGRVMCYTFPYSISNGPVPGPIPLAPIDSFPFREAFQGD